MRAQSTLALIARTAQEETLGISIVLVRIVTGLVLIAAAGVIAQTFEGTCFWLPFLVKSLDACGGVAHVGTAAWLGVSGGLLTIGLFVRPVALINTLFVGVVLFASMIGVALLPQEELRGLSWLLVVVCGLLAAGGSGNTFGVNGLLYRNMRRHTWISRFFLG